VVVVGGPVAAVAAAAAAAVAARVGGSMLLLLAKGRLCTRCQAATAAQRVVARPAFVVLLRVCALAPHFAILLLLLSAL
jgi:hypothetical protein